MPAAAEGGLVGVAQGLDAAALHAPAPATVRVRLDLSYDGTGFSGWAAQRERRTVQGVLEQALHTLLRAPSPRLTVAGRTDAGVHARGQVAHVDLPPEVAHDRLLLRRLNGLVPPDVRVRAVTAAPAGFDARFSALSRTYRYRVADAPDLLDALRRAEVLAWPRRLDLPAMQAAATGLLGLHDYAAYCRRREGATTVRTLLECGWTRDDAGLAVLTVTADAFCHSMVRSLVGALLLVGERRRAPDWPVTLLTLGRRATDLPVAPPHGLVLEAVGYPSDDELLARQAVTRDIRSALHRS